MYKKRGSHCVARRRGGRRKQLNGGSDRDEGKAGYKWEKWRGLLVAVFE